MSQFNKIKRDFNSLTPFEAICVLAAIIVIVVSVINFLERI